jgi:hypothetical protein
MPTITSISNIPEQPCNGSEDAIVLSLHRVLRARVIHLNVLERPLALEIYVRSLPCAPCRSRASAGARRQTLLIAPMKLSTAGDQPSPLSRSRNVPLSMCTNPVRYKCPASAASGSRTPDSAPRRTCTGSSRKCTPSAGKCKRTVCTPGHWCGAASAAARRSCRRTRNAVGSFRMSRSESHP